MQTPSYRAIGVPKSSLTKRLNRWLSFWAISGCKPHIYICVISGCKRKIPSSRVCRPAAPLLYPSSGCKPHCCIHHLAASRIVQQGRAKPQFTRRGPRSGPSAITATQRAPIKSTRRRRCPQEDFHKTPVGNILHSLELVPKNPVVSVRGLLCFLER